MTSNFFERPILNSPYECPTRIINWMKTASRSMKSLISVVAPKISRRFQTEKTQTSEYPNLA